MLSKINKNLYKYAKITKIFAIMLGLFILISQIQVSYSFEDGIYQKYTLSMLEDGDFNLINQMQSDEFNWLVSSSGYHSDFQLSAVSAYLAPFIGYEKLVSNVGNKNNKFSGYILAIVFYVMIALIFLFLIMREMKIKNGMQAAMFYFLATSFVWYFFFCSTTVNIFGFAYSILAFAFFLLTKDKKMHKQDFFILGIITGLGFVIRIELLWIGSLYLYTFFFERIKRISIGPFVVGFALPMLFFAFNNYLRAGSWHHFSALVRPDSVFYFFPRTLSYALIGENGYLTHFPFYGLLFVAVLMLIMAKVKIPHRPLLFFLFLPVLLIFIFYNSQWPLMDSLTDRHQLCFGFIYLLLLAIILDEVQNQFKNIYRLLQFMLLICSCWAIYSILVYYKVDTGSQGDWQYEYHVLNSSFYEVINNFIFQIKIRSLKKTILNALIYLPFIGLLSLAISQINLKHSAKNIKFLKIFFLGGFSVYFLFTVSNFYFGKRNVEKYHQLGWYSKKVTVKSEAALRYDDFIEVNRKAIFYYLKNNECETVERLLQIRTDFLKEVVQSISYDPIGFKSDLNHFLIRKSNLESSQFVDSVQNEFKTKCSFLMKSYQSLKINDLKFRNNMTKRES